MLLYIKATVQLLPISGEPVAATFSEPSLTGISIYEPLPSSSSSLCSSHPTDDSDDEVDGDNADATTSLCLAPAISARRKQQCREKSDRNVSQRWTAASPFHE